MKIVLILFAVFLLAGCGKDEIKYPKSYTFSHVDQNDEGLFLLSSPSSATTLNVNTGLYGVYRESLKEESREGIQTIFDLQEIILLSENMLRIHVIIDEEVTDTVISYTKEEEEIIIDAFLGTDLIKYESEDDQFVLCGFTTIPIAGPNVTNPGPQYNNWTIEDCQEGADLNDHLNYVLQQNDFVVLDTIGLFVTKIIYR